MHLLHARGVCRLDLMPGIPFVIGRSSDCRLVLVDQAVSRRHATISLGRDEVVLKDEHSSNGTFVNGRRLERGETVVLASCDAIDIGASRLVFFLEEVLPLHDTTAVLQRGHNEQARPLVDLLWDAHARAVSAENEEDRRVFATIFDTASAERRLVDAAALVGARLEASVAVIFLPDGATLGPGGVHPEGQPLEPLQSLARRAWSSRAGRIVGGVVAVEGRATRDTCADPFYSAIAVPFESEGTLLGVVGAERMRRSRFDDANLEHLARLGERLAEAVTSCGASVSPPRAGPALS